ncbi:MAG: hypothetical protein IJT81_00700 [Lachnospiraceae bacterium]|nr:hypothetical protein [Lachnospiraceae bacterium]
MGNRSDISRNQFMLKGALSKKGYDWWWHNFTGVNEETGERKQFYVEFFGCNPAKAKEKPYFVWNKPKKKLGDRPSYFMVNVGYWGKDHAQLHRFFPWKDVNIYDGVPFVVEAGDCICSEVYTEGSVSVHSDIEKKHPEWMSDVGTMSWALEIDKKIAFNVGYGASAFFRKIDAFEMFWHAEGIKTEYKGEVVLNGEKYIVSPKDCNGYADKNWGKDFTSPWIWLSSNNLTSLLTGRKLHNSVFEIGGGRPKIYFVPLNKKLLGVFHYEGRDYEFNFSKFWTLSKTRFKCFETKKEVVWHIVQDTRKARLVANVHCKKDEMLNINYESPDGHKRHNRLWNGGTGRGELLLYKKGLFGKLKLVDDVLAEDIGCEYGEYND